MRLLKTNKSSKPVVNLLDDDIVCVDSLALESVTLANSALRSLQKQAQQADHLQALFAELPAGLVIVDSEGKVSQCNACAEQLLGEPLLNENWASVIKRAFAPRRDDGHDVSLHDGRRLSITTRALSAGTGQLILLHDVTATRQLQERVSRHQRLSRMGKMVASIAHQLRTPLSAAILYASNMINNDLSSQQYKDFANKILQRLHNVEGQISDMLLFARGGSNVVAPIAVSALLNELTARVDVLLQQYMAQLIIDNQSQAVEIYCNQDALLGALQNIIVNALEAKGQACLIKLKVNVVETQLQMTFTDNGPGMSPSLIQQVFQPFFTTKQNGTGLGLAVVKAIIEAHQGQVQINKSQAQEGCAIKITLPLRQGQQQYSDDKLGVNGGE